MVQAAGWQRDHWSRNSWPGLVYPMDRPRPLAAAGIPFAFRYESGGRTETGVPGGRTPFTAPAPEVLAPGR